jgi:hypothetical protein
MRFILGFYKIQTYLLTRSLPGENSYFVTDTVFLTKTKNSHSHLAHGSHIFETFAPMASVVELTATM